MPFKFPFILIGTFTKAFLTSQSWCVLKSWYPDGGSEKGFRCGFANRLNQSFRVSFVGQAIVHLSDLLSGNYPGLEWVLLSSWKTLWFFYPGVLFCFAFLITAHNNIILHYQMEDKTKWLKKIKIIQRIKQKQNHWKKKKLGFSTWIASRLHEIWKKEQCCHEKSERRLKLLTEFLSKTLKTKAANFEGSPKGKNCWYIFWNSYKRHTHRQEKYEKNSWIRKMLYRANVSVSFVDFSEFTVCMGCFRAVESWEPLPIYSTPVA